MRAVGWEAEGEDEDEDNDEDEDEDEDVEILVYDPNSAVGGLIAGSAEDDGPTALEDEDGEWSCSGSVGESVGSVEMVQALSVPEPDPSVLL
jgi:hypothetical protein